MINTFVFAFSAGQQDNDEKTVPLMPNLHQNATSNSTRIEVSKEKPKKQRKHEIVPIRSQLQEITSRNLTPKTTLSQEIDKTDNPNTKRHHF